MAFGTVAEKGRAPARGIHIGRGLRAVKRTLANPRDQIRPACSQHFLHRVQHVEQGFLPHLGFTQTGQRFDAGAQGQGEILRRGFGWQLFAQRHQQGAKDRARGAADHGHTGLAHGFE